MKLFVGSLSRDVSGDDLKEVFSAYGELVSCAVIFDRETRTSKGFGFVEFKDADAAQNAMKELNQKEIKGRAIVVNEARPKTDDRPARKPFNRGQGGGGGRRY